MADFKCGYDLDEKTFRVNFGEFFELGTEEYDVFFLGRKRSYAKEDCASKIKQVFDALIERGCDEALSLYLSAHRDATEGEEYTAEMLASDCEELSFMALAYAREFIDGEYHPEEETRKRRKSNTELQYTDEHNKITLAAAFLMKFIIPLVVDFADRRGIKRPDELLLDCFVGCFAAAESGTEVILMNKLYKIVESRIKTTRYSDRTMWAFLSNFAIDPMTLADQHYRKLLVDIMPKLRNDRKVISYFHVVLKNLLAFQFRYNFPVTYNSMDLHEVTDPNNDRLTNFERVEYYMNRVDESEAMVEEAKRQDLIVNALRDPAHPVTAEEMEYYQDRVQLNPVQTSLLFLHNARRIGKVQSLYGLRYGEYVALLVSFRRWLDANGFAYLSKWVTSTFEAGLVDKKPVNTRDFAVGLINSRTFKYLHDTKYMHVMPMLLRNNTIAKVISTIYTNNPSYLPTWEEHQSEADVSGVRMDYPIAHVADEVLRFLETV